LAKPASLTGVKVRVRRVCFTWPRHVGSESWMQEKRREKLLKRLHMHLSWAPAELALCLARTLYPEKLQGIHTLISAVSLSSPCFTCTF
jgi:hypothetical protein